MPEDDVDQNSTEFLNAKKQMDKLVDPVDKWLGGRKINVKPILEFKNLLREYLRSAHDRVCPEVNWEEK